MNDPRGPLMRRALACFLAGVYAVGAFAGLVHVAAVEHERCAEHGEIMHASAALERAEHVLSLFDESRLRPGERAEKHGDHDHCLIMAPSSQEVLALSHCVVVKPLQVRVASVALALTGSDDAHGEALYRLAPKHGPPTA